MSVRHLSFVESVIYEAYYCYVTQCSLVDMYRLFAGAASSSEPLAHKYQSARRHIL